MSIIAFSIGILLTTTCGFLAVSIAEGTTKVLGRGERIAWSLTLGPTVAMFVVFLSHVSGLTALNRMGFLIPIGTMIVVLGVIGWITKSVSVWRSAPSFVHTHTHPRWMTIGILILCVWTAVKIFAGTYSLVSVPTYWDDSFNNWNMRGKMFFVTQELKLEIPAGNGVITDAGSVNSYPVTLPLTKTYVSTLLGSWNEPLVNAVQLVWFAGLLGVFYSALRRSFDRLMSAFGVYLLASLPLVLIHGVNPYAEILVASHILVAAAALLGILRSHQHEARSWIRLFGLSLGLLILTKNEALILHAPLLALTAAIFSRNKLIEYRKTMILGLGIAVAIALPWLAFKLAHGLTFGNAKAVSGVSFDFNPVVLHAIWYHITHEPNWLMLPVALPIALACAGQKFWKTTEASLAAFALTSITAQCILLTIVPALSTEAINQTGISRGFLHIMPIAVLALLYAMKMILAKND